MKSQPFRLVAAGLLVVLAAPLAAQDRADIDRTQIIGNKELPKVTYIVPWKKPLPGAAADAVPNGVLDEALAPVDREVFRRQLRYDAAARAASAPATPATAAAMPTTTSPAR